LLKTQNSLADRQIHNKREIKAKHPQLCKDTKERSKQKNTHNCTKDGTFGVQKSIKECGTNSIHQQQNWSHKISIEKISFFARKSQNLDRRDQTNNNNTDFFLFWVSAFKMWISSKNVIHPSVDSSKSVKLSFIFFLWILQECKPKFLLPPVDSSRVYLISFFSSFLHKLHHNIYAHQPN
jgi:hypothetical protein